MNRLAEVFVSKIINASKTRKLVNDFGYMCSARWHRRLKVAFRTIIEMIPMLRHLKKIRFVLHDDKARAVHETTLSRLVGGR